MAELPLSKHDMELLLKLHDFMYLDKDYIKKYIYTTYTNDVSVNNRLARLSKHDYITSFAVQKSRKSLKMHHIYTLGQQGADVLESLKGIIHWKPTWSKELRPMWRHQIMIAETVKEMELQAGSVGLEVKEFIPEPRSFYKFDGADAGKQFNVIRPDGIVVIGKPGSDANVGIMLEMERSYSDREYTIRKITQYNRFFSRYSETGPAYDRYVGFDHRIADWRILFIGGTAAKTHKLLRDLIGEEPEVTVLVGSKEMIDQNPFGAVYRVAENPENYRTL